jgi:predicted branched-subunit amino acid permease
MSNQNPERLNEFLAGARAELPILLGVAPFGMIYGVLALAAGLPPVQAQAMSAVLFAGSSQFVLTQLVSQHTPALVMLLTVFVINLRHALYSASVAPYIQHLPLRWKITLAYLLTDEAYAVAILHYEQDGAVPASGSPAPKAPVPLMAHFYFLGAGLALWSTWQLSTAVGVFLGAVIPSSWELDFTLALTFIALVIPNLKDRAGVAAAVSAGVVSVLAFHMPYKLGLIVAALAGVAAGMLFRPRKTVLQSGEADAQ